MTSRYTKLLAQESNVRQLERIGVGVLVAIFICFTWHGLQMFFSGDDLMNTYKAWILPIRNVWKSQFLPWMAVYRPAGTLVYRIFFKNFGFHPLPLYIFGELLLIANVFVGWRFFRALAASPFEGLMALALVLVHGTFDSLYLSMGTIYDRLCFTFTALAVIVYARFRREGTPLGAGRVALICFICLMAMNSKESGAAVPVILFCYECIYCLPNVWRESGVGKWLRSITPLYLLLAAMLAAFWWGRVRHTPDLTDNPGYRQNAQLGVWLSHVAQYLEILIYQAAHPSAAAAAITLLVMPALALFLRNRAMLFGWAFFALGITPVALIPMRQGFVLYVPELGLGLYLAALIGVVGAPLLRRAPNPLAAQVGLFAVVAGLSVWVHRAHWARPWNPRDTPQWGLTEKMRQDYPLLKRGAHVLFASDYFAQDTYDPLFTLRLLYGDNLIEAQRLHAPKDQQPDPKHPMDYDLVLMASQGSYLELDNHNVEESVQLRIPRDYSVGRHFETTHRDRIAYLVSGVLDSDRFDGGLWTTGSARLRFDVYPADSTLALKFYVPHEVANGKARTLSVTVGGGSVGTFALSKEGFYELRFPVPARAISGSGFTEVGLDVDDPYKDGTQDYGVVILRAGFDYVKK